jgi:hypothetical protein
VLLFIVAHQPALLVFHHRCFQASLSSKEHNSTNTDLETLRKEFDLDLGGLNRRRKGRTGEERRVEKEEAREKAAVLVLLPTDDDEGSLAKRSSRAASPRPATGTQGKKKRMGRWALQPGTACQPRSPFFLLQNLLLFRS